jgi:hypothetical protein
MHRSRLCHFVIDVSDLGQGIAFWSAGLGATEETLPVNSQPVYRQLRRPDSDIRILLQKTLTRRPPKSACTSTWRPTTSTPRSRA